MGVEWIETDKHVYGTILRQHQKQCGVFSSVTDKNGIFGEPLVLTEWGFKNADYPIVKAETRFGDVINVIEEIDYKEREESHTYFIAVITKEVADE